MPSRLLSAAAPVTVLSITASTTSDPVGAQVVFTATFDMAVSGVDTTSFELDTDGLVVATSCSPAPGAFSAAWELTVDIPLLDRNATMTTHVLEYGATLPAPNMVSGPTSVTLLADHLPGCWMRYACTDDCVTLRPFLATTMEVGEVRCCGCGCVLRAGAWLPVACMHGCLGHACAHYCSTLAHQPVLCAATCTNAQVLLESAPVFHDNSFPYSRSAENLTVSVRGFGVSCGHLMYSFDVVVAGASCENAVSVSTATDVTYLARLVHGPANGVEVLAGLDVPELTNLQVRVNITDVLDQDHYYCSRSFIVDTTRPLHGTVLDLPVHRASVIDIDDQAETDSLRASWLGWSDDTPIRYRYVSSSLQAAATSTPGRLVCPRPFADSC